MTTNDREGRERGDANFTEANRLEDYSINLVGEKKSEQLVSSPSSLSSSDEEATNSTSSSLFTSSASNNSQEPTIVQTFVMQKANAKVKGQAKMQDEDTPARRQSRDSTAPNELDDLETNSRSSSSVASSYNKRYKNSPFGLRNHFITMPEVNELGPMINSYTATRGKHDWNKLQQDATIAPETIPKDPELTKRLRPPPPPTTTRLQQQQQDYPPSSESSLVSSPPISPPAPGSKDVWQDRGFAAEKKFEYANGGASNSRQRPPVVLISQPLSHRVDFNQSHLLVPAGDAGLDASQCNSKAKVIDANCYPDQHNRQQPAGHHDHHQHQHQHQHQHLMGNSQRSPSSGNFKQLPPPLPRPNNRDTVASKSMTSDNYWDAGSLLVRFSSIMYATFLVILGCILHVSELRQKSKNSSDHIYTTIVALIGIIWLLFLQADLHKYKRYARRYILIESIVTDQNNQSSSSSKATRRQQQLAGMNQAQTPHSAHHQPPSSSSRASSSASLVNDRISLNTEVIFKKTAYKMYQQQAALDRRLQQQVPASRRNLHYAPNNQRNHPHHYNKYNKHNNDETQQQHNQNQDQLNFNLLSCERNQLIPAYKFLHGKMGANFYLKCGMAAFCFGHIIHEGLRFGQQLYFFSSSNSQCRDLAALIAHLVTPLYSFYQLFMMFKYSNLVINRHKVLARFGLMHIVGTSVSFWFRTILEEAFEDFVHKMDYFRAQNKQLLPASMRNLELLLGTSTQPINNNNQQAQQQQPQPQQQQQPPTFTNQSAIWALMSSPNQATIGPQLARSLPESYACAQNTLLTTKSMNALPYLYPFTIEYNLLLAATFLSLYFNIGKIGPLKTTSRCNNNPAAPTTTTTAATNATAKPSNGNRVRLRKSSSLSPASSAASSSNRSSSGLSYVGSSSQHELISDHSAAFAMNRHGSFKQHQSRAENEDEAGVGGGYDEEDDDDDDEMLAHYNNKRSHHLDYREHHQRSSGSSRSALSSISSIGGGGRHHLHNNHDNHSKYMAEYKSNFVVNADCHSANKGLFCGFFVLLVTLVTIVIFFVTINKPSHLQLGIKINLIQEASLTSLLLVVCLVGFKQLVKLNRNYYLNNKVTTDDVLMLIPLPFFFIHSLLAFRAETATLYPISATNSNHHVISGQINSNNENAAAVAAVAAINHHNQLQQQPTLLARLDLSHNNGNSGDALLQPIILFEPKSNANNNNYNSKLDNLDNSLNRLDDGQMVARRPFGIVTNGDGKLVAAAATATSSQKAPTLPSNRGNNGSSSQLLLPNESSSSSINNSANNNRRTSGNGGSSSDTGGENTRSMDPFKLLTICLNVGVMLEVLIQTNFIIDGLRRCSETRYLRFKKPGRELVTFAIILNITYWIVATFETKSVEQYKTEIEYYGPLSYMFISHTTLPVMLFYRYHSSVCLAEIWNRAYKPAKER